MPVPDFQTIMLPFMRLLADGQEWKMRDVVEALASGFSLTDEERQEMLPSGQSKVFNSVLACHAQSLRAAANSATRMKARSISNF
jgi:restriction system protein